MQPTISAPDGIISALHLSAPDLQAEAVRIRHQAECWCQMYKMLLQTSACVQPVSCDEAYLDATGLGDPSEVATSIRQHSSSSCVHHVMYCSTVKRHKSNVERQRAFPFQVYKILLQATACVQPVSCDEAYLDVTGLGDPSEVATSIRQQILEATGCTASAGIGPCMLVARLATKKGKPNGQFRIQSDQVHLHFLVLKPDSLHQTSHL